MTSADIRQIKMNYLQHNKNVPIAPSGLGKTVEIGGQTASQVALLKQQVKPTTAAAARLAINYNSNEFGPPNKQQLAEVAATKAILPEKQPLQKKEDRHPQDKVLEYLKDG